MPILRLQPDVEAIAIAYLLEQPAITDLVDDRVHSEIPAATTWPVLTVQATGGPTPVVPQWIAQTRLQVDARGESTARVAVSLLARTAWAVLWHLPGTYDDGVITACRLERAPQWLPDRDTDASRYSLDVAVWSHPRRD